jgi:hypothetical protein
VDAGREVAIARVRRNGVEYRQRVAVRGISVRRLRIERGQVQRIAGRFALRRVDDVTCVRVSVREQDVGEQPQSLQIAQIRFLEIPLCLGGE